MPYASVCLSGCCLIIPSLPHTQVHDQRLHSSPEGHFLIALLQKSRRAAAVLSEWTGSHRHVPRMSVKAGCVSGKLERGATPAAPCPCGFGLLPTSPGGRRHQEDGEGERTRLAHSTLEEGIFRFIHRSPIHSPRPAPCRQQAGAGDLR